jgi:hypothetical protein
MKTRPARLTTWRTGALVAVLALSAGGVAASPAAAAGPTAGNLRIYGVAGGDPGYIAQGRRFYACANNVVDPAGVKSVTTDISSIGVLYPQGGYDQHYLQNFPMTNDWMYTMVCDGDITTDWEADWPTNSPRAEGVYPWSVTMTDTANISSTQSSTVTVDNTPPKGVDVQSANKTGGTKGKPEQGDTLTYSYSETMNRFLADNSPRNVVVRINYTGSNDTLTVWNAYNSALDGYEGTVTLGRSYVPANRTFGATGTPSTIVRNGGQVTLTLGTPSGTVKTVTSQSTKMAWTPSGATDRAGNPESTTPATESGTAHPEF